MFVRLFLFVSLLIPLLRHDPAGHRNVPRDTALLGQAAVRLAHHRLATVSRWLESQNGVASALRGGDGRTLDIRFTDGSESVVLPALPPVTHRVSRTIAGLAVSHTSEMGAGRAIVLEPFAAELNLGPDAGDAEVTALKSDGFSVDQAYDGAVTVSTIDSLPRYNVVYMLTHSGVNAQGEGVIATGQVANGDPSMQPYLDDHTVLIVGVAGSETKYYGVLSGYFTQHTGQFPPESLMVVNGCSMLRASLVWQALAAHNVRTMVSWDNEGRANDDVAAAQTFFQSMAGGKSVSDSVADVARSGFGTSIVDGTVARFGYLGDGSLTLHDVLVPPTSTPPPTPTIMPSSTALPTASASPIPHRPYTWPKPVLLRTVIRP